MVTCLLYSSSYSKPLLINYYVTLEIKGIVHYIYHEPLPLCFLIVN
jgi:hypothetical protein